MGRKKVGNVRQKPSGRWEASVSVGTKEDGTPRRVYETFDSEAEARAWAYEKSMELGRRPDLGRGVTLDQWWGAYRSGKGSRVAKGTMRSYATCMRTVWLPELGGTDISRIDAATIQDILLEQGRAKAQHCKSALSAVLTAAVNYGTLSENVMLGTRFEMPLDTGREMDREEDYDENPFAAIEGTADHWDALEVAMAIPLMRDLRLEPAWLAMVGAGLRMQEAFAIRGVDVRRVRIGGRPGADIIATQLAVHHAESLDDGRKRTKTRKSVRIATMMEPFGTRYWELSQRVGKADNVCGMTRNNVNRMWRNYFAEPAPDMEKYKPRKRSDRWDKGRLRDLRYVCLSKMRKSHETMMQQAEVLDSVNASMHGHSQRVAYTNYLDADVAEAVIRTQEWFAQNALKLVV